MSLNARVRKLSPLAALAVAAGIGCTADRDVWMTQIGDYLFEFPVDATLQGGAPGGSNAVLAFDVAAIDLTLGSDPLGRITRAGAGGGYCATCAAFSVPGWNFQNWDRNATNDPRLPALASTTARIVPRATAANNNGFNIWAPRAIGFPEHNPWTDGYIDGLTPGGVYTIAFYRYSLEVNGTLDAAQVVLGQAVTQPDQLAPLGGTPGGFPGVAAVHWSVVIPAVANANPFVIGHFVADANGEGYFDITIDSNDVLYGSTAVPTAAQFDSALIARNDNVATTFPRYNYFVIHEGTAATAADVVNLPQVVRVQLGGDLDPSGAPILNANAPFPAQPMTAAQLLAGTGVAGKVADTRATFRNLAQLSGATYQAWMVNEETGAAVSVPGDWVATVTDEDGAVDTVATADGARTFNPMGHWTVTFHTSNAIAGTDIGEFTHVVLSIESAEATTPAAAQPLWVRHTNMAGEPTDPFEWSFVTAGTATFGTFNLGNNPVPFVPRGAARGHFHGTGPDDQFRVQFRDMSRPPVGYFYEGWMIPESGAPFSLGHLVAPVQDNHASLRDADISTEMSQFVRIDRILDALQLTTIGDFQGGIAPWDLAEYRLMLSPKQRAEMPPYTVLAGDIPDAVAARAP